jgi:hypothetical protein
VPGKIFLHLDEALFFQASGISMHGKGGAVKEVLNECSNTERFGMGFKQPTSLLKNVSGIPSKSSCEQQAPENNKTAPSEGELVSQIASSIIERNKAAMGKKKKASRSHLQRTIDNILGGKNL